MEPPVYIRVDTGSSPVLPTNFAKTHMSKWILYILRCKGGSLYTGITTDLKGRVKKHNEGKASKYTRSRRPVKVFYKELLRNESQARKREAEIKKLSHREKLDLVR